MTKSRSIRVGPGGKCPKDGAVMDRFEHEQGFKPRPGQPYHFRYWDRCDCGHLQHYDDAKVYPAGAPARPQVQMTPDQVRASHALKDRLPNMPQRKRRQWLAREMGIEERHVVLSQFDAVECATVLEICAEPQRNGRAA